MKAYSLTKILTFVTILFMGCVGFAQTSGPYGESEGAARLRVENENKQRCQAAIEKVSEKYAKASAACKANGASIKDCKNKIDECSDSYEEEAEDITVSPLISNIIDPYALSGGTASGCYPDSKSEYRSEERDAKSEEKQAKKDLREAQKKKITDYEDYTKAVKQADDDLMTAQTDKVAQDLQFDEDQRTKAEKREQSAAEMDKAINSKELEILQYQNAIKAKILARQNQVNQYRIGILECQLKAEDAASKSAQAPNKSKGSGSINSAASRGQSKNKVLKEIFDTCVQGILAKRSAEGDAYRAEIETLNTALSQFQTTLATMKTNKENAKAREAQADAIEKAAKANKDILDKQKYQNLLEQKSQISQAYQQKQIQNSQENNELRSDVNRASSDLANLKRSRPKGKKSIGDADDLYEEFANAKRPCLTACADFKSLRDACAPDTGKAPPLETSVPVKGAQ